MRALATFQMYCAARPMQAAAARALSDPGSAAWLEEARTRYGLAAQAAAQVLGVTAPDSGSFLFFDTRPWRRAEETCTQFLQRCALAGVVLTEGRACGSMYDEWARLCFTAVPPDTLDRALRTLARLLATD